MPRRSARRLALAAALLSRVARARFSIFSSSACRGSRRNRRRRTDRFGAISGGCVLLTAIKSIDPGVRASRTRARRSARSRITAYANSSHPPRCRNVSVMSCLVSARLKNIASGGRTSNIALRRSGGVKPSANAPDSLACTFAPRSVIRSRLRRMWRIGSAQVQKPVMVTVWGSILSSASQTEVIG